MLSLAWSVANALSNRYFLQRMELLSSHATAAMQEVNQQIEEALSTLQRLERTGQVCEPQLYSDISTLVAANRFVYEAAIQVNSGKACSSYGHESDNVPVSSSNRFFPGAQFEYWFFADPTTTADDGFIVVSQGVSYLWLNKGIVLSALNLGDGVGFDLVDQKTRQSVFSNDQRIVENELPAEIGSLTFGGHSVRYAQTNQWQGLVSLLSLPLVEYQKTWWGFFALALGGSLILPAGLFMLVRSARQRYISIVLKLRKALKRNQLRVNYQPIVNMNTGEWVGMESLLRWSPGGKPLSPAVFIPAAEESGMIGEVTRWVVRRVAEDYSQYLWACKGLYITINLSAQDVEDETFADFVRELLADFEMPAHLIIFEVTESSLLDRDKASLQLQRLRSQGHRVAVDDFGTGYSSLSYISELPIDILKIDRSFLDPEKMHSEEALWRHVVSMAKSLNLNVVAEGIEQEAQAVALRNEGVVLAQGWLYARDFAPAILAKHFFRLREGEYSNLGSPDSIGHKSL